MLYFHIIYVYLFMFMFILFFYFYIYAIFIFYLGRVGEEAQLAYHCIGNVKKTWTNQKLKKRK